MIISKRSKVTLGVVISLLTVAASAGKVMDRVESNSRRIDSIEDDVKKTREDVSYLRGQWDTRFKK